MSIVITGASGKLGRATAKYVLEQTDDVVLVTRSPEKVADLGGEARFGDFDDPASLTAAFAGASKILIISTDVVGARLQGHLNAVAAAGASGAELIAYTSIPNPSHNNPAGVVPDHRETEDAIRATGVPFTFLRNAIYAEIMALGADAARASGKYVTNAGDGRSAHVLHDDCARAAAAVLTTDGHANKVYDITGPEALGVEQIAALYGEGIEVVKLDDEAWIAAMSEHMPEAGARLFASFGTATRQGYAAAVSSAVKDLTGREPGPASAAVLSAASR
jgi:NAD(P)H dehydrogenase (quinone)